MYINGRNGVLEALRAGERVEKVYFLYGATGDGMGAVRGEAKRAGVPCTTIDKERFRDLERKARLKTRSQGVIAWINPVHYADLDDMVTFAYQQGRMPMLVAMDEINDPHNIGAIIRSAECAGLDGILLGKRNSPGLNDVVMKTSAGAAHFVPVGRADDLAHSLNRLRDAGLTIIGLDERGTMAYSDVNFTEPTVIVIGNEGQGISSDVLAVCDTLVSIPMMGKIASLNASVAAGVVFFEALRQRTVQKANEPQPYSNQRVREK